MTDENNDYAYKRAMHTHPTLSPIEIGSHEVKNRLGLGPINSGLFGKNGNADNGGIAFYKQYIDDGLGIIYVGGVAVSPEGRSNAHSLLLNKDDRTLSLRRIVSLANESHSTIIVQLMHAGRQANPDEIGSAIVAPSSIPCPIVNHLPVELSKKEIRRISNDFAHSAKLAEESGAHIVELHASHGYLISGFLSPYSNVRIDEYGGTLKNRFRFLNEVFNKVSEKVSVPVGIRINCFENVIGGLTLEEVIEGVSEYLDGIPAYIAVSAGVYAKQDIIIPDRQMGKAVWRQQSETLKRYLPIPIMLSGNIDSLELADDVIQKNEADIVLMVRALLSDPNFLQKSLSKQKNDIQECIECYGCKYHSRGKDFVFCPFNSILVKMHTDLNKATSMANSETI